MADVHTEYLLLWGLERKDRFGSWIVFGDDFDHFEESSFESVIRIFRKNFGIFVIQLSHLLSSVLHKNFASPTLSSM